MIIDYTSTTTDSRDYEGLCSEDRAAYYRAANQSVAKRIGDIAENFILKVLASKGYNVRKSTAEEDVRLHADLILDDSVTIDVKNKTKFYLELQNRWGGKGWLFTGADYIIQMFHDSNYWSQDEIYIYDRREMVKYYQKNSPIFQMKYCERMRDGSILWALGKKRLETMSFVKKIKLS